ncbi:MAG: RluA family pseudouridine synthase [Myxococcales bacterium]|nr:RluA family pseudouridine synthase [Myxococcales bacterium]
MRTLTFTVSASEAGQRLDKLVVARAELGRRRVAELFSQGHVVVAGRRIPKGELAREGDEIVVSLEGDDRPSPEPEARLTVRLETPHLVIVAKPAGQPSAPLRGEGGTLAGALLGHYPEMEGVGHSPREPGILHRLDTQTSGLLVAARSVDAFNRLHAALRQGAMTKRYLALVPAEGLPDAGVIDAPIAPDRKNPKRVLVVDGLAPRTGKNRARPAETRFRLVKAVGPLALVELTVSRALRHQIRAHLASIGHPLLGDVVYGGQSSEALGERHALHASYVAWAGDDTIAGFALDEPLPGDMASLIAG